MSFSDRLMAVPPHDTSGSRSANRFDYQLDWALQQVVDLYPRGIDFVVALDYHDDVLVLDSATDPTNVICYQIKTKDNGNWTVDELLKRPPGKDGLKPSILGKLYAHFIRWGPEVVSLRFASNAPLNAVDQDGRSTRAVGTVLFTNLDGPTVARVGSAIGVEHSLGVPDGVQVALFQFKRTSLGVVGHQDQCLGLIARFLEAQAVTSRVPAAAFYRVVKDEMARAVQREECPTTFLELCSNKSLTRARFAQMLVEASSEPTREDYAAKLGARLNSEQVPFRDVNAASRAAQRLTVRRLDPLDKLLHDDLRTIKMHCTPVNIRARLWDSIAVVTAAIARSNPEMERRHGIQELWGLIGVILLEQTQLQSSDPQAPEATT